MAIISVEKIPSLKNDKTSSCGSAKQRRYMLSLCAGMLLFLSSGLQSLLFAQDEINVSRDREKTVYTIDSSDENRQEQEKERDRAWDMLKNMPIIIDKKPGQPLPGKPVQPAPGK